MTATLLAPPDEIIHLSGISWQTYETLLDELCHRHLRLTYNRGNLEIMAPSPEHEFSKTVMGRFVETCSASILLATNTQYSAVFFCPTTYFNRVANQAPTTNKCHVSLTISNNPFYRHYGIPCKCPNGLTFVSAIST